jgi:hypothetical protein
MKHNQKDDASKQQKQMPKNQQANGNNGKSAQHGSPDRDQQDDHQMGKQGPKKHAEEGKTR